MPEPLMRVFPGGGSPTFIDRGGPDRPALVEVEWRNPTPERIQENEAFYALVRGSIDPWEIHIGGTLYRPCYFEADSLKSEVIHGHSRQVVRFRATKATPEPKGE